jgi:uncharacterized membrane-anchored protein
MKSAWSSLKSFLTIIITVAVIALAFVAACGGTVLSNELIGTIVGGLISGFTMLLTFYFTKKQGDDSSSPDTTQQVVTYTKPQD